MYYVSQDELKTGTFFGNAYATAEMKRLYQVINLFLGKHNHVVVFKKNRRVSPNLSMERVGTIVI